LERGAGGWQRTKQFAGKRRWLVVAVAALTAYLWLAYTVLPALWSHPEHEPGLSSLPMVTRTASDIPGDPLNVGLVGTKADVFQAMHAAGWYPADPITLRTSVEIVGSVVLDRPYHDAPSVRFTTKDKKNSSRSRNPMARARTGDIMSGFGRSSRKERTVARSGSVQ
jgi:hypothetical protein